MSAINSINDLIKTVVALLPEVTGMQVGVADNTEPDDPASYFVASYRFVDKNKSPYLLDIMYLNRQPVGIMRLEIDGEPVSTNFNPFASSQEEKTGLEALRVKLDNLLLQNNQKPIVLML